MSNITERTFEALTHIYSDGDGDINIINGYLVDVNESTLNDIAALTNTRAENILTVVANTYESTEIRYPFEGYVAIVTKEGEFISLDQFPENQSINIMKQQLQEALELYSYKYEKKDAFEYIDFSIFDKADYLSWDDVALLNGYIRSLTEKETSDIAKRLKNEGVLLEDGKRIDMKPLYEQFPKYNGYVVNSDNIFKNLHFDNEIDLSPVKSNQQSNENEGIMPNVNFLGYLTDEQYDAIIERAGISNILDNNGEVNVYFEAMLPEIDSDLSLVNITATVEYDVNDSEKRQAANIPLTDDERMIIKDKMNDYCNQKEGKGLNEMLQEANDYAKEQQEYSKSKHTPKQNTVNKSNIEK